MTQDLLEEMDDDRQEASLDRSMVPAKEPFWKKSVLKKLTNVKKKRLVILLVGVLLIGMLAGVGFFFFGGPSEEAKITAKVNPADPNMPGNPDKTDEIVFEDIVALEPFVRIPLKTGSAMELVSLDISLELVDPGQKKQVEALQDRIRKIVMAQVREMRWLELKNPEGKIQLKYELLTQINAIFPKAAVRNVYFTNLIMQR